MASSVESERDRAYRLLVDLIMSGGWGPDINLSERKLCDTIQMGRMPIREALQQLEREGLVGVRPARGTFVRQLDIADLREVYQVREALECLATSLAAGRELTTELRTSRLVLQDMLAHPDSYTAAEIDDAGTAFHNEIYAAAGNRALVETFLPLRARARLAFGLPRFFDPSETIGGLNEHLAILAAIEARDPPGAAELMREHLRRGLELRIRLHESRKGQETPNTTAMGGVGSGIGRNANRKRGDT